MLRLYLLDPVSGISIDCERPDQPWDLKEAVAALIDKVVAEKGASIHQVMFQPTPFRICAEELPL